MISRIYLSILGASSSSLQEEINFLINRGKIDMDKADSIYKELLQTEFKGISPKSEESKHRLLYKYKQLLISEICKDQGANCSSYLDTMFPFIRGIS